MSDPQAILDGYRAEIASFEARARALREPFLSGNYEANQREAVRLDEEACTLRRLLSALMRETFGTADQHHEEEADPESEVGTDGDEHH